MKASVYRMCVNPHCYNTVEQLTEASLVDISQGYQRPCVAIRPVVKVCCGLCATPSEDRVMDVIQTSLSWWDYPFRRRKWKKSRKKKWALNSCMNEYILRASSSEWGRGAVYVFMGWDGGGRDLWWSEKLWWRAENNLRYIRHTSYPALPPLFQVIDSAPQQPLLIESSALHEGNSICLILRKRIERL